MKEKIRLIINRIFLTCLLILVQIAWFILFIFKLTDYSTVISVLFTLISLLIVVFMVSKDVNPAFKVGWIIVIMALPLFGGLFYLCFGDKKPTRKMRRKMHIEHRDLKKYLCQDENVLKSLEVESKRASETSNYITKYSDYPVYFNTETKYYTIGEEMFADMIEELEKAEHFIFLEYFIISEGKMWNKILEILTRKANEGVEVRIIYDDIGCLALLPPGYDIHIENLSKNISCMAFNPFIPFFSLVMNNRDHRKIMVIDGKTAFTGGINISDEYINEIKKYGHWKDTGVRLKGDGVKNFTIIFLETWRAYRKDNFSVEEFIGNDNEKIIDEKSEQSENKQNWLEIMQPKDTGYVQPFSDTPLENEPIAENVYIEILNQAEEYVYIYTPYLIVDDEMKMALCMAAKRGVDVRIVTPGIPDKKIIYRLTRSNYSPLLKSGIKIYEYTPGFIHAKSYVCDDKYGVVGTINMDFRSLYLHFECGTYMYKTPAVMELKQDCIETFKKCRKVELEDTRQGFFGSLFDAILRVLSPML